MALAGGVLGWLDGVLDAAIRRSVEAAVAAAAPPDRAGIDAVERELGGLRRELATTRDDVQGLRQAVDAWTLELDDEVLGLLQGDVATRLDEAVARQGQLERRVVRMDAALALVHEQLGDLRGRVTALRARADQAFQVAVSARATAESVAEGLDENPR